MPEVYVGRLSVATLESAHRQIEKIKNYNNVWCEQRMLRTILMNHRGNDMDEWEFFYGVIRDINSTRYSLYDPMFQIFDGRSNGNSANVVSTVYWWWPIIINYIGHGNRESWFHWGNDYASFYGLHIDQINPPYLPVVFSIACDTGDITCPYGLSPCMGEYWLDAGGGAVGFIGSTEGACAYDCLDEWLFKVLYSEGEGHLGKVLTGAKLSVLKTYYGTNNWQYAVHDYLSFLLLGDPSLCIIPKGDTLTEDMDGNYIATKDKKEEKAKNSSMKISPNPTEGNCYIKLANFQPGQIEISIYDLSGRLISKTAGISESGDECYQLDLKQYNLKSGIYFIQISSTTASLTGKIIYCNSSN